MKLDALDRWMIKQCFKVTVKVFAVLVFIVILGRYIITKETMNTTSDMEPLEKSGLRPHMVAYNAFLSQDSIDWSEWEETSNEKLMFCIFDLDGDQTEELLVQNNDGGLSSMSPVQKILKYNHDKAELQVLWQSIGAYDWFSGYDKQQRFFLTERGVKGTFTTFVYDTQGVLKGEKEIYENPLANEFEQIAITTRYVWDGKEVAADTFEQELFNSVGYLSMRGLERVELVENTEELRAKYLK